MFRFAEKKSGFAWAASFELKPTENNALRELTEMAATTYKTRTGGALPTSKFVDPNADVPKAIWNSQQLCVLVAKEVASTSADTGDGEGGDGDSESDGASAAAAADGEAPVVTCAYLNPAAAEAFGYPDADGYKALLDLPLPELTATVGKGGKYESGYEKKLVRREGAPLQGAEPSVMLTDVSRWTLEKMAVVGGKLATEVVGVAYCWESWTLPDGTTCLPGGVRQAAEQDPAEVAAAIEAQGALIRKMKEEDGLTNDDEPVKEAVAELLRLKALQ